MRRIIVMTPAQRTARRALTRRRAARFVRALGVGLTVAAGVGTLGVIADRLFALGAPAWLLIAGPSVAAIIVAAVYAAAHRPTLLAVASDVDRALGLKDRLGSGMALADAADGDPFAALAVDDSDHAANSARVRDATPIALDSWWWGWPALLAAAVALAIFMPVLDIAGRAAMSAQQAARTEIARDAASDLAAAREAITSPAAAEADLPDAEVRTLQELEEQLASGGVDPDRARAEAAGALGDAASRLEQQAESEEDRLDALRDRLAQARAAEGSETGERSALSEALERGDLDRAAEELARLADSLDTMDDAERARRARELRDLAEQAARAAEADQPATNSERSAEDDLRELGVDEQTRDALRDEPDRDAARDALRDAGVDEATAEELADRLTEERRRRETEEQASEDARRLSDALEQAADEVAPEPAPEPGEARERSPDKPDPNTQDGTKPDQNKQAGDTEREQPSPDKSEPQQGDSKPSEATPKDPKQDETKQDERKQGDPGQADPNKGQQEQGEQKQGEPGRTGDNQPKPTPGGREPQPAGEPKPTPTKSPDQPAQPGERGTPEPGSGEPSDQQPGARPGAEPGQPGESEAPGVGEPDAEGVERARRLIDEMRERAKQAGENRERAEEARRRAKEMHDRLSPAERERLARWAEALSNERPGADRPSQAAGDGFVRDPMGLRSPGADADRVIAEWANPEAGEPTGGVSRRPLDERMQEAAEGAERAIEEQRVHRRYNEIVRRYFERARREPERPADEPPD